MSSIILLIILILLSAFFSGIETAFVSLSRLKVKHLVKQRKSGAKAVERLKQHPKRMIITILIGNNLVNVGASAVATVMAIENFGSNGVGIATGIMTFLILVFGEITPKTFATVHAATISLWTARTIEILSYVLYPIVYLFESFIKFLMRLFKADKTRPIITEEEFKTMVEVGAKENAIEQKEREFIEGVLEFNDIPVNDVMTSKKKMFMLSGDLTVKEALGKINKSKFSRIPIYNKSKDYIIGILNIKDVLEVLRRDKTNIYLKDLCKKPFFVKENRIISNIFKEFQDRHVHMAIVTGEHDKIKGLVTLEDLLEEIFGEILDEKDLSPEFIIRVSKNNVLVHGKTEIDDIIDFFNVDIQKKQCKTIGEFFSKLHKGPVKVGSRIKIKNVYLRAEEVINKEVRKILVIKK